MNRRELLQLLGLSSASVFLPAIALDRAGRSIYEMEKRPGYSVVQLNVVGVSIVGNGFGRVAIWYHKGKIFELACAEFGGLATWVAPFEQRLLLDRHAIRMARRGEVEAVLTLRAPSGEFVLCTTVEEE